MSIKNCLPLQLLLCNAFAAGALIWSAPSFSQSCVDSDGDGWGWDGQQSCRITSVQSPSASAGGACIDSDGDGYGWDGTATCLVGDAPAGGATASSTSSASAQCIDDDGDGWGWDGMNSCRPAASAAPTTPTASTPTAPTPTQTTPVTSSGGFNRQTDLVALHYDHAPDPDDAHAAVAGVMVKDKLGLQVQVVAGTYGEHSRDRYNPGSEAVMSAVWGSAWLNAHSNREGAVNAAVNRWAAVMGAGGSIWVAEGGPSDFTAEVVRRINQRHSEFDTRSRIHVIQHSVWNEDHALASDLSYVRSNTRYVKIEDGNHPNSTADLRFESHNNGSFVSRALSSSYSNAWGAAFAYLSPSDKLDFSDTVELLHIVGLGRNVIADVNDFGDYFF